MERWFCTLRQRVGRLVRKTLSFSKSVERYAIAGVKRYRIVSEAFRSLREGMVDAVMEGAYKLHNLRCTMRTQAANPQMA